MVERLSLSKNIVNVGTFLKNCLRLLVLRVTFHGVGSAMLEEALTALEAAVALGLILSLLGMQPNLYNGGHIA